MVFWLLKKYDSQIVLRSTIYRKSMAGFIFIWSYFGPEKTKIFIKFSKVTMQKGLQVYLDLLPFLDLFLESFFLVFSGGGRLENVDPAPTDQSIGIDRSIGL
jgi:hypothetical protein